jgi:dTDP-4-dehydrorhamnose reductase
VTTVSGKHVLILGSAMGLGEALYQQFELGNLPASHVLVSQLHWRDPAELQQQILQIKPSLVVNVLPLDILETSESQGSDLVACTRRLVQTCQRHSIKVLQLSSATVFEAGDKKAYDENEKPCVSSVQGKALLACEESFSQEFEQWILLRLAWLINTDGANLFTECMQALTARGTMEADPNVRVAPVWLDDALRVVATLVRQVLAGAENWGVFHYGSADPCTEKEFAQQIAESLAELKPDWSLEIASKPIEDQKKISSVLKSRRVRNNFGVHGRTWRQGLRARIQFWLDSQRAQHGAGNAIPASDQKLEMCSTLRG